MHVVLREWLRSTDEEEGRVKSIAKVRLQRDGALAILTLDDPKHMNAIDDQMRLELVAAMNDAIDDDAVRAIVLTGAGKSFCAGANLKEMFREQEAGVVPEVAVKLRDYINPMLVRMAAANKPIIAAVNGPAVGVGCGLALAADIVLVSRPAYFLQSFIRLGVVPDGGSSWLIPRLAGWGRGAAMMLLGERIDAETAVQWGLAYRLYEAEDLRPAALAMGAQLAQGPRLAYASIKRLLQQSRCNDFATQLAIEAEAQGAAFLTADCNEGIAAFMQKRQPHFTGG